MVEKQLDFQITFEIIQRARELPAADRDEFVKYACDIVRGTLEPSMADIERACATTLNRMHARE